MCPSAWPGNSTTLQPADLVAFTEQASVGNEVDEPAVYAADLEQLRRLLGRDALPGEPRGQLRDPGVAAPDLLALVVVDRPLQDRCSSRLDGIGGAADMVGMEVRDQDLGDRTVELRYERRPVLGHLRQAQPGVDEQVPARGGHEVPVDVAGLHRHRIGDADDPVRDLDRCERMFYHGGDGGRVSRRALPERAEPGEGYGVRLVAEPLYGLRAPLHVLLRARLRAAGRPAVRRSLRTLDSGEGERGGGASAGACAAVLGRRGRRDRRGDRSLPAGRGAVQADPRLPRGAPRRVEPVQPDHPQPDGRPRPRRPRRGGVAGGGRRRLLGADARRGGLAPDRARHPAAAPPARGARASWSRRG